MDLYSCASFFAGVGGIELGFEQNGFKIVYANEMDDNAVRTYELNFSVKVDHKKIQDVDFKHDIPKVGVILAGFPCQSFSIAGYQKGFNDEKNGHLFFDLAKIIEDKKPYVLFLENVKNLLSHDNGNTYRVIKDTLEKLGYHVKHQVLNAMEYGNIPQNRERIYIVAFRRKSDYKNFEFPEPIKLTTKLSDVIDFNDKVDSKYYYTASNCSFFPDLKKNIKSMDTVYQWRRVYVRENKSKVCPTLTANMGGGGHNVPLVLTKYGIRKLTPHECFNLQGFPKTYKLPADMAATHLYKQAGNSVVVTVISRIAKNIKDVLDKSCSNK